MAKAAQLGAVPKVTARWRSTQNWSLGSLRKCMLEILEAYGCHSLGIGCALKRK